MIRHFFAVAVVAIHAAALSGCPQTGAANPNNPDASDAAVKLLPDAGDAADQACAALRGWKCPMGFDQGCAGAFRLPSKFGANPACALTSSSAQEASAKCNIQCGVADAGP